MRAVIQRVKEASVSIDGERVGRISKGILILLGVSADDTEAEADWMVNKLAQLRIFNDDDGKMNLSLEDVGGAALVVSQFTLFGDCRKGRRPSYIKAARPETAIPLYEYFVNEFRKAGFQTETGRFGAMMDVALVNDGPVTLIVETPGEK